MRESPGLGDCPDQSRGREGPGRTSHVCECTRKRSVLLAEFGDELVAGL